MMCNLRTALVTRDLLESRSKWCEAAENEDTDTYQDEAVILVHNACDRAKESQVSEEYSKGQAPLSISQPQRAMLQTK